MKNFIALYFVMSTSLIYAQSTGFSVKVGYDYYHTQTKILGNNSFDPARGNIGYHTSRTGHRAGLVYEYQIFKWLSAMSEAGYAQGGFDTYNYSSTTKIDQAYLNIAPQLHVTRFFKIHTGLAFNKNFIKNTGLSQFVEKYNWGYNLGGAVVFNRFSLGLHYTHHFNYYYDYSKLFFPHSTAGEKEYWNIMGVQLAYQFSVKRNKTLLSDKNR
jgi:hypothetical protein